MTLIRTSNIIKSIKNGNDQYSYDYDGLYNIVDIYHNDNLLKHYDYDEYNELIKEENYDINNKIEYSYDNYGNILSKVVKNLENNVIMSTDTYQYSNSNWQDQLTSYNGTSITYDNLGNPITIGNSISMEWINGRSLYSYQDTSKNLSVVYKYDENGIRNSKIVNGIETKYFLEGTRIIYEQKNNNVISYLYDSTGLLGLVYNDNVYYYIKNLQGDIIGILDSNYTIVASYNYDSWGKLLSIKDSNGNNITDSNNIGIINPFRYRSYYYDTETELYYLNTRYYNPTWGRFINADGIIGANKDIMSYNLYAYVSSNPIFRSDPSGEGILNKIITVVNNFMKLKTAEKIQVILHPISAYKSLSSAKKATSYGKKIYGDDILNKDSGVANAYKHTMWNAIMTYDMDEDMAEKFASAHENGETSDESKMDLHNNIVGREIGKIYKENEKIMLQNQYFSFSLIYISGESYQSFDYLGKTFTISNFSNPYDVMSEMVQHAINQGALTILVD